MLICNAAIARTTISWQEQTRYFDKQRSSNRLPTTTMRLLISDNESSSNHHMLQEKQPWQLQPQCTASIDNQTCYDNNASDS